MCHNLIMIGPPGSGKTMLAKRLPIIIPPITFDESIETTKAFSVVGMLESDQALVTTLPFRPPSILMLLNTLIQQVHG